MMPTYLNEHFAENVIAADVEIDFAFQPYDSGKGKIVKMTPRMVERREFFPRYGGVIMKYEVWDIEIAVREGHHIGALWGGVPVQGTRTDMAGTTTRMVGCTTGEVRQAVFGDQEIVTVDGKPKLVTKEGSRRAIIHIAC